MNTWAFVGSSGEDCPIDTTFLQIYPNCRDFNRKFLNIMFFYPHRRTRSEPTGASSHPDPIWSTQLPPLRLSAERNHNPCTCRNTASRAMLHHPSLSSREPRLGPNGGCHNAHRQPLCHLQCKVGSNNKSIRPRGSWWKRIFMAPVDGIIWIMEKFCFKPSDECLQCVQMTYYVMLILGAIISAAVTILPLR